MSELRAAGIVVDMDVSDRSVKSQFKVADREGATYCIVVGESELTSNTVVLKKLATAQQTTVARSELIARLKAD